MAEVKSKVGSCTVWVGKHSPDNREVLMTGSGGGTLSMYQYEYPDKRSRQDREGNTVGVEGKLNLLQSHQVTRQGNIII